jgi:glycosyltransferase involved in cell wall biosynthesis
MVDEIIVPSNWLQDIFASHGYRARVIPNVVNTSQFRFCERKRLRPFLLSVRNFERHYRVDKTIVAFARIKARFAEATLTIVGNGSEDEELRGLAEELGLSDIQFLGRIEPAALPPIYDAAHIFVNSSVVDNQPVSILEAFACGLPVVSTGPGDIAGMLRGGEAGLIIDDEDPSAMANAVARLLGDRDLSLRITSRARKELERYTWPAVLEQWSSVYAQVIASAVAGQRDETPAHV